MPEPLTRPYDNIYAFFRDVRQHVRETGRQVMACDDAVDRNFQFLDRERQLTWSINADVAKRSLLKQGSTPDHEVEAVKRNTKKAALRLAYVNGVLGELALTDLRAIIARISIEPVLGFPQHATMLIRNTPVGPTFCLGWKRGTGGGEMVERALPTFTVEEDFLGFVRDTFAAYLILQGQQALRVDHKPYLVRAEGKADLLAPFLALAEGMRLIKR